MSKETTIEDFRLAAARSKEEGAAVFIQILEEVDLKREVSRVEKFALVRQAINATDQQEIVAVAWAHREFGLGA